ncbi:cytochrome c oxidase assembly protein [Microbacterium hydrocarbonoxydans]|uniref:cytochrome c oxidase assembly protein n=1 Tax=Microbacterium hydrocarbonoxydans TaxID=273678 RepID=UPI003B82F75C
MRFLAFALLSLAIPCSLSSRRRSPSQPWSSTHGTMEAEDRANGFSGRHSPLARFTRRPVVAASLFATSLWLFHYSDLFRWSLYDQLGAEWMISQLLVTGASSYDRFPRTRPRLPRGGGVWPHSLRSQAWPLSSASPLSLAPTSSSRSGLAPWADVGTHPPAGPGPRRSRHLDDRGNARNPHRLLRPPHETQQQTYRQHPVPAGRKDPRP